MKCRDCDYSLWRLPGRECPECGLPFKPSDEIFKPGAVKFCCPDCMQQYYGTSSKGHLRPLEFDCVQCGRHLHMDETVLLPGDGVSDEQAAIIQASPWSRGNRNVVSRWFRTVGWAYAKPSDLISGTPAENTVLSSFWFLVLTQLVIVGIGVGLPLLIIALIGGLPFGGPGPSAGLSGIVGGLAFGGGMLVVACVMSGLWALLSHLSLVVTGGCAYPLSRTFSAICLSSGTLAIQAVPCVGPYCLGYVVFVWWIVSAILMLMHGQKVSGLRATIAVLWPPLLLIGSVIIFYIYMISTLFITAAGAMNQGNLAFNNLTLESVGAEVFEYTLRTDGDYPESIFDAYGSEAPGFPNIVDLGRVIAGGDLQVDVLPGIDAIDFTGMIGDRRREALADLREAQQIWRTEGAGDMFVIQNGTFVYCLPGYADSDFRLSEFSEVTPILLMYFSVDTMMPGVVVDEPTIGLHWFDTDKMSGNASYSREELITWLAQRDADRSELGLPSLMEAGLSAFDRAVEIAKGDRDP